MLSCPLPGTLDSLVEYAKSVGLDNRAEIEALRAYMMLNSILKEGQQPKVPTPEEFDKMMDIAGVFINSPNKPVVLPDRNHGFERDSDAFPEYKEMLNPTPINAQTTAQLRVSATLTNLVSRLASNVGVKYQFITKEQATELTAGINQWSGQPGFFLGDTVYLIPELMDEKTAFHEFAHPVIRAIQQSNPELYKKLVEEFNSLPEAQQILERAKAAYPTLAEDDPIIMEEALVISLTNAATEKSTSAFNKFINNLLYAIKQALRKIFGKDNKVSIEKLKPDTTLSELADLLMIQPLDIDIAEISREDLAVYATELDEYITAMTDFSEEGTIQGINDLYSKVNTWLKVVEKNKDYEAMKEILKDLYQKSDLSELMKNLTPYQTENAYLAAEISKLRKDAEFAKGRTEAFVLNLLRMKAMSQRVRKAVAVYAKDVNNPENVGKVYYINNIVDSWDEFLNNMQQVIDKELDDSNITADNPIIELVDGIRSEIESIRRETDKVYKEGSSEIIKKTLTPMMENIDNKYKSLLDSFTKRGAPQSVIDQLNQDYWGLVGQELSTFLRYKAIAEANGTLTSTQKQVYEKLKLKSYVEGAYLTPEKIDYTMTGRLKDAGGMNSFLEPFMYNQDPIVSGFAVWVKNKMTDVFTTSQRIGNEFLTEMRPLMEAAGYNQADPSAFGARVTFNNKKGGKDENGNFIVKEVPTFLMPYRDYQMVLSQMDHDIQMAKEASEATSDNTEVIRLQLEKDKFLKDFFHRPYTDEYYNRFDVFRKTADDEIGAKAEFLRSQALARIQNMESSKSTMTIGEANDVTEDLKVLYREYRQLFSNYTEGGQLKTGEDLAIAERLREFREASRGLYDYNLVPNQFENSLAAYEDYLIKGKKYSRGSAAFINLRQKWIADNTRIKIKDKFYEDRQVLLDQLAAITAKIPKNERAQYDYAEQQKKILMLMNPFRDADNQPEGTAMTIDNLAKIKESQKELEEINKNIARLNGLTKIEQEFLDDYFQRRTAGEVMSPEDTLYKNELLAKQSMYGLTKEDKEKFFDIKAKINEMQESLPTDYYLDVINNLTGYLPDTTIIQQVLGSKDVDHENAFDVLTKEFYEKVASQNPTFKRWYEDNHIFTTRKNKDGETEMHIERTRAWSVVRPKSSFYYETHSFINSKGEEEVLGVIPAQQYYETEVKEKFVNKPVTMLEAIEQGDPTLATIDNKGDYLPKMNAADNRFINDKFFEVKKNDPKLYAALLGLSKWHLKFQEDNPRSSKLFMEVPRFRKHGYEITRDALRGNGENPISKWWKNFLRMIRSSWRQSADPYDQGLNFDDQFLAMNGELFEEDNGNGIPIHGLANLDANEVSLDLTFGMMKYMVSSEKQKALIKMNPMARALQTVVNNPENSANQIKELSKKTMSYRNIVNFAAEKTGMRKKKSESVRAKAINNFIEREFEGVTNTGIFSGKETQWVQKLASNIMGASAFGYFALDVGSALKNSLSSRLQSMIEAAGGRYFNHANYAKGTIWANQMSVEMSLNVYKFGPKGKNEQLVQIFDAYQGRFEDKFHEMGSRSITKDALGGLSWMTSFRKWTEINSTLSAFGAMMYHEKNVKRTVNGVTQNISYMDAWEMGPDNQIRLKDGVDPEWGIGGDKFKAFKNKVHGVTNNLNGAFAKFDYAEADRYLAFRFVNAFKRWFIRLFLNKYQFRGSIFNPKYRYDAAIGDTVMGHHVEALKYFVKGIGSMGKSLPFMRPSEKVAVMKTLMDAVYIMMFSWIISSIFGFHYHDEDRYAKLRERSGPLPFFGVAENEREFQLKGWLTNHLLYLSMQTKNELSSIIPITSAGFGSYIDMLQFKSVAMGNTVKNYVKMGNALINLSTGDDSAFFDQREGPYTWLQAGNEDSWTDGNKAIAYALRSMGMTGKSIDPATATVNFVKSQNWR